ncbi:hypothetical protein VTO42DRAFT_1382 [Malbranchea cinnamomea]
MEVELVASYPGTSRGLCELNRDLIFSTAWTAWVSGGITRSEENEINTTLGGGITRASKSRVGGWQKKKKVSRAMERRKKRQTKTRERREKERREEKKRRMGKKYCQQRASTQQGGRAAGDTRLGKSHQSSGRPTSARCGVCGWGLALLQHPRVLLGQSILRTYDC